MPRVANEAHERLSIRLTASAKARLMDAAAIQSTDLSHFVLQIALQEADRVIDRAHRIELSARETDWLLDLLDNPPPPGERLIAAAQARYGPK